MQRKRRRCGISPREYDAKRDLLELHALLDSGMRPAEIAKEMGKDPAWVSRKMKELRENATLAFRKPCEGELITQALTRFETLYHQAFRAAMKNQGVAKVGLFRVACAIMRQFSDYQIRVGLVEERRRCAPIDMEADAVIQLYAEHRKQEQEEAAMGL